MKTLSFVALAALLFDVAAAGADQASYLSKGASYCEIFQAINPEVPERCHDELGLRRDGALTRGLTTGPIGIQTPQQAARQTGRHDAPGTATSNGGYSIAMRVPFHFDSDRLTDEAKSILDRVGQVLNSVLMKDESILVEGHADATGEEEYNLLLSTRRALAVQVYLVEEHMIAMDRLQVTGRGEADPYDPARPQASFNRRVEFTNLGA